MLVSDWYLGYLMTIFNERSYTLSNEARRWSLMLHIIWEKAIMVYFDHEILLESLRKMKRDSSQNIN
jgi:hypothetical protein